MKFDLSGIRKIAGLLLCACSMSGLAQVVGAHPPPAHAGNPATDVLSAVAMPQAPNAVKFAAAEGMEGMNGTNHAVTAAVADGVTTGIALSSGAIEMNPLISTSPLGLVAMTGMKIGLAKYAETLPEPDKRLTLKSSSAVWGGAAVNNLMVLFAAPPPLPIIAGLLMGFATWTHMETQYQEQDQLAAARNAAQLAAGQQTEAEKVPAAQAQAAPAAVPEAATIVTAEAQAASVEVQAAPSLAQGFGSSGE